MNIAKTISAFTLLLGVCAAPSAAQERQSLPDFSYSEGVKGADCRIAFRSVDGTTWIDFGIGISDATFTVEALKNRWEIIDGQDTNVTNVPLTLTFGNGDTTTSSYGGFKNGFNQGVWAQWHDPSSEPIAASREAFEMLMEADFVAVSNEDGLLTEANLGPKGFAANKLLDCGEAERAKLEG